MDRLSNLASAIANKEFHKIDSDLKHNSFYSESEKTIVRTLLGGLDSRQINDYNRQSAIELGRKLISMKAIDSDYCEKRVESLLKQLKGL